MEWQQITPDDEPENSCYYCGNRCDDTYCSDYCKSADIYD